MRRRAVAVLLLLQVLQILAAERVIDDTDENSEDIFERPPRLESIDDTPPAETASSSPAELQFHSRGHKGFGVEEDKEDEENQGSDGFPRLTAMVDAPSIATNETQEHLLPLPNGNEDRPLDGIRTDTRTGKTRVSAPFPTLMAGTEDEAETIVELTVAPNTSLSGFGSALAQGEHSPVVEYDVEESAGTSAEEAATPVERNLTAAVVFHSKKTTTDASAALATTTTASSVAAAAATTDTVTPHASHFPTRDRAGIFPSESTEQLTSHGHPTEKPVSVHSTTSEAGEPTDPPFAMVDPTIFNPDQLFAVPGAPGIQETPEVAKEIAEEDSELKAALSEEAHLPTSTIMSIMTSIAPSTTTPSTTSTTTTTTEEPTTTTEQMTSPTTTEEATTMETVFTTQEPVEETTTKFQLPPLIATPSTTVAPATETTPTTHATHPTHPSTHFTTPDSSAEEPVHAHHNTHNAEDHGQPPVTVATEEMHFEDRALETTESMPFDPTAAHFGDSQEGEELWKITHGHNEMEKTTTTEPLVAHKTPFHITVRDLDYLPDFADPDSGKFRKLRDQLLPDLRRQFEKALHDFIAVDLTSVEKERSVVVHGVVYTRNSIIDLYDTANKFESVLESNGMRVGGNEVETGSFAINGIAARAPVERVQQSAGADGSIAFIIAGIITIGVIVILIVVCVIILMNNHRRGVGSIKLKEDAEAEAGRRTQMHTYGNVNLMSYNSPPPPQPPSTQLLQQLPHVVINTKNGSRPSSVSRPSSMTTSPISPRSTAMHRD